MGLTMKKCDYCDQVFETGVYSEDGDFCSQTCADLEAWSRDEIYKDIAFGDTFQDYAEYQAELMVDLELGK